jgi:hypothetical protein
VGEQREVLEDESDPTLFGGRRSRRIRDDLAEESHRTGVGFLEAGDEAQQRRLPASRWAEQREELAWCDRQVDAVDGADRSVRLRDARQLDRR